MNEKGPAAAGRPEEAGYDPKDELAGRDGCPLDVTAASRHRRVAQSLIRKVGCGHSSFPRTRARTACARLGTDGRAVSFGLRPLALRPRLTAGLPCAVLHARYRQGGPNPYGPGADVLKAGAGGPRARGVPPAGGEAAPRRVR